MCWRAEYWYTLWHESGGGCIGKSCNFDGWAELKEEGGFPTITPEQRALQLRRLQGLGKEPTQEELGEMRWPHRCWWADRDRIGECQSLEPSPPSNPAQPTHPKPPMSTVLLIEYIWHLEEEMEQILEEENHLDYDDLNSDPNKWLMDKVLVRAMRLWKGEQVDGSNLQWGPNKWLDIEPRDILSLPTAVMAGWRYLTSLKSTPRYMRSPMHVSLESRSWYEFNESGRV